MDKISSKPGWSFIEFPPAIEKRLADIIAKVPSDWRCNPHGQISPNHVQHLHCTFVSDLPQNKKEQVEAKIQAVLDNTPPIEATFAPVGITIDHVKRITKATATYCAAIGIVSPALRSLREKIAEVVGDGAKVYYNHDGHVSLIYVHLPHKSDLEKIVASLGTNAEQQGLGGRFLIDRVVVEWNRHQRREYRLGGGKKGGEDASQQVNATSM